MIVVLLVIFIFVLIYIDIMNRDKYFDELIEYIPKGAEVLDFGAGKCELSKYIGTRNTVTSIDIQKSCDGSDVYDGYKLPYDDNSFDVVVSMFVLHHIPHNENILNELTRVTRNKLIIVEDMPTSFYQKLVAKVHYLFFHQPMHTIEHMKTPTEWCAILGGDCEIKRLRSSSFINTTPHYVIIKDVSDTQPHTYHFRR